MGTKVFDYSILSVFILSSFLLCLSPGPDNIYVLTLGVTKNTKSAIITILGLCTGLVFHTIAATFGISIIFKTSQIAFDIVKYLGAIYLLYIAYQIYIHKDEKIQLGERLTKIEYKKLYIRGFIMNILNPKVSIFFLAFLPQFVDEKSGNIPLQMIVLGLLFIIIAFFVFSLIGIIGNKLKEKILSNTDFLKYLNFITIFVLVSLSISLAISSR